MCICLNGWPFCSAASNARQVVARAHIIRPMRAARPYFIAGALMIGLAACTPAAIVPPAAPPAPEAAPVGPDFGLPRPVPPQRANAAMVQDFLDLSFQLESGRVLPVLSRFEGPITLRAVGAAPPTFAPDLARLLGRLRDEAGITIAQVPASQPASITVELVSGTQMRRLVPQAMCFVVPRVSGWADYTAKRRSPDLDWTTLRTRTTLSVFIPTDVGPQEIRDCLNEELAQALGPLNDLYRLPDSVFNDDNMHVVLTGFDMLMLRVTYAPELRSGMSRAEVAAALPAILARENPAGGRIAAPVTRPTPREWSDAITTALGPGAVGQRPQAAQSALDIAQAAGWNDNRTAFSYYVLGRLFTASQPQVALAAFLQADALYRARPETALHAAHLTPQFAAYALSGGRAEAALALIDADLAQVRASENAGLLAAMLMIRAEALDALGRSSEAHAVRLDSLIWARYGIGAERDVQARLAEIAALTPSNTEARTH